MHLLDSGKLMANLSLAPRRALTLPLFAVETDIPAPASSRRSALTDEISIIPQASWVIFKTVLWYIM